MGSRGIGPVLLDDGLGWPAERGCSGSAGPCALTPSCLPAFVPVLPLRCSGTLSFIFNNLSHEKPFSEVRLQCPSRCPPCSQCMPLGPPQCWCSPCPRCMALASGPAGLALAWPGGRQCPCCQPAPAEGPSCALPPAAPCCCCRRRFQAVSGAFRRGYTEPDPRDDLTGDPSWRLVNSGKSLFPKRTFPFPGRPHRWLWFLERLCGLLAFFQDRKSVV